LHMIIAFSNAITTKQLWDVINAIRAVGGKCK
jgi:hypothetical protein